MPRRTFRQIFQEQDEEFPRPSVAMSKAPPIPQGPVYSDPYNDPAIRNMTPEALKIYQGISSGRRAQERLSETRKQNAFQRAASERDYGFNREKFGYEQQKDLPVMQKNVLELTAEEAKQRDEAMLQRVLYGAEMPQIKSELESSTTGYAPGTPAYKFSKDPFKIQRLKAEAVAAGKEEAKPTKENPDFTRSLTFLNSFVPGDTMLEQNENGENVKVPVTRRNLERAVSLRFKLKKDEMNSPEIRQALTRFDAKPEAPSMFGGLKETSGAALQRIKGMFSRNKTAQPASVAQFASEEEAHAANLPEGTLIMIDGRRAIYRR